MESSQASFGRVMQVSVSRGGVPKRAISRGILRREGFSGDSFAHPQFHGGPNQAVLLVASEVIDMLTARGYPVFPGALGENVTTVGLDPGSWRAGQQYRIGSARVELTKVRVPCRTLDVYGSGADPIQNIIFSSRVKRGDVSADEWGRSGFYARVVQEGEIAAGEPIVLESQSV